ncbi:hypothetical protein MIND_00403100 [Mycena indigotica]|uniref:Uncharacterized protein n=1 Tax=Mycena indigotica TaxID=2126181 RepID=A0A8H6WBI8_9AGAR|nr:uncharacterized protein MIND_00403100 [Mycena indigotica]KAF7310291.1 hypothetical protein MIND_00403100 [Mycena indigotica]
MPPLIRAFPFTFICPSNFGGALTDSDIDIQDGLLMCSYTDARAADCKYFLSDGTLDQSLSRPDCPGNAQTADESTTTRIQAVPVTSTAFRTMTVLVTTTQTQLQTVAGLATAFTQSGITVTQTVATSGSQTPELRSLIETTTLTSQPSFLPVPTIPQTLVPAAQRALIALSVVTGILLISFCIILILFHRFWRSRRWDTGKNTRDIDPEKGAFIIHRVTGDAGLAQEVPISPLAGGAVQTIDPPRSTFAPVPVTTLSDEAVANPFSSTPSLVQTSSRLSQSTAQTSNQVVTQLEDDETNINILAQRVLSVDSFSVPPELRPPSTQLDIARQNEVLRLRLSRLEMELGLLDQLSVEHDSLPPSYHSPSQKSGAQLLVEETASQFGEGRSI